MKPYLTFLFLSLALSLMAQEQVFKALPMSDSMRYAIYDGGIVHTKLHRLQVSNGTKEWIVEIAMKGDLPVVEVFGEWSMQVTDDQSFVLKPRGYKADQLQVIPPAMAPPTTIKATFDQMTTNEIYVAMERLKDAIENALGADKIPDDVTLLKRITQKPQFEFTGSLVHVEGVMTRYFTYCDIVNLLTELDKK